MKEVDSTAVATVKAISDNFYEFCNQNNIACAFILFNLKDSSYIATAEQIPVLKDPTLTDNMAPQERFFYEELLGVWKSMETSFKTGVYNLQRLLEEHYSDIKLNVYSNEEIRK